MTDKLAGMFGSYVDAKFMRGLKVLRVSVDVPIERANEFLTAFGAPDGADPVPVAIARLNVAALKAPSVQEEPEQAEKPRTPFRDLPRSQQAAIKCQDDVFIKWLRQNCHGAWHRASMVANDEDPLSVTANDTLKEVLRITSKKELDTNTEKAADWDRMLASFDYKDRT